MCLKPLIGALSDRWGRRTWLLAGTLLFAGTPFLYRFVHTPEQLLGLRLFHGLATAIYGPVTLAFVAERASQDKAEKLGWFGMARSGGYIVGPAAAGWLLTYLEPVTVFTIIGLLSCLAFIPIVLLEDLKTSAASPYPSVGRQVAAGLKFGALAPSLWLAGSLEATVFIALYAVKAFLPIFALNQGMSVALVGTFFSIQEAIYLVLRPVGGRLGDQLGYQTAIALGMGLIALCLSLLPWAHSPLALLVLAGCIGAGQSLIFPSTIALAASRVDPSHTGAGMGLIGTLKNAGKVAGPLLGGLLIHWLDYTWMFWAMTALLVIGAATLWNWRPEAENERRGTP
jgi:MFS family permease